MSRDDDLTTIAKACLDADGTNGDDSGWDR